MCAVNNKTTAGTPHNKPSIKPAQWDENRSGKSHCSTIPNANGTPNITGGGTRTLGQSVFPVFKKFSWAYGYRVHRTFFLRLLANRLSGFRHDGRKDHGLAVFHAEYLGTEIHAELTADAEVRTDLGFHDALSGTYHDERHLEARHGL